jgi:hypothetical protein
MLQNATMTSRKAYSWFMAAACSLNLVFGTFALASSLGIPYYHFYLRKTVSIVVFSPYADWLAWLASAAMMAAVMVVWLAVGSQDKRMLLRALLPCAALVASLTIFSYGSPLGAIISALLGYAAVALTILYGKGLLFMSRKGSLALVLACSGMALIAIEAASLSSWLSNPFDYQFPFSDTPRWASPTADLNIFSVLYPLVPGLLLALLLSWLWVPLRGKLLAHLVRWGTALAGDVLKPTHIDRRIQAAVLSVSAALAGFIAYYPYIRLSAEYLVGRDGVNYYNFLVRMTDVWSFTTVAPDRPLFMLLLYSLKGVTQQPPEAIIRFMPVACAALLVLAVFWLVKTGTKDTRLALLSSVLTAFSFNVTAGMMGYFLANWCAMIGMMIFFTLLLKALEGRTLVYSALAGLASMVVLGFHPYSWLLMAAILAFYIVVTVIVRRGIGREVLVLAAPLAMTVAAAVPLVLITKVGAAALSSLMAPVKSLWQAMIASMGPSKLLLLTSLSRMADLWVGGAFGSPLVYILCILGMAAMADLRKNFNRLLFCWVLAPFLIIFAVVPSMEPYYYRIAYVVPFQIVTAVGFSWLLLKLGGALAPSGPEPAHMTHARLLQAVLFALLVLILINYAIRIVDQVVVLSI